MASQNRSVWEIRFRALKEALRIRERDLYDEAGRQFLEKKVWNPESPVTDQRYDSKEQLRAKVAVVEGLLRFANEIEEEHPANIWLECDR